MDFIWLIINSIFDLIILIAFFKMSANTTKIVSSDKRNARANYYKYLTLNNNKAAYEQFLYIIFFDLTEPTLDENSRRVKYDNLKNKYSTAFTKLGYEFPDFPF